MKTEHKCLKTKPIHYYITGAQNATCLFFLHPAFADHRAFDKQVAFFAKGYRVITMDLIGHGRSQKIKTNTGISASSSHIKEIMDEENIVKAHFVGVSVGSLIAQDFSNKNPTMVMSLCALGGYDINNYDKSIENQQRKQQLGFIFKALISIRWFSKANALVTAKTKEAQDDFYQMNRIFLRRSFKYMASLGDIMNQCKLEERPYPLLILCGESDNLLALELAKKWNKSEPKSAFGIISNSGHCANMDNPLEFNNVLSGFILGCGQ